MKTFFRNLFCNRNRYREHSEAVIISCFFNSENSPYRIKAFQHFYNSIRHMNHHIVECVIGNGEKQLPPASGIQTIYTQNLLWHKEALLNYTIKNLPEKYRYVFWVDADVLFTNKNWLVDSVHELKNGANVVQPFEYCVHLEKDELKPKFNLQAQIPACGTKYRHPNVWRSFCANYVDKQEHWQSKDYNTHGHVGFAWGARREILEKVPLFDKALIGGADHIMAHAAAGQLCHDCITKSFTDDIDNVNQWSKEFDNVVNGKIGYTKGNLYHIWHGDIQKRQYLKRVQEFTSQAKEINQKDKNGLYVTGNRDNSYMKGYFRSREVSPDVNHHHNYYHHHTHTESATHATTNPKPVENPFS
jgi:hypothetical protein